MSAPHGGDLLPTEIPDRTFGVTGADRTTKELTLAVRDAFLEQTGLAPHVIISHLHRRKLDPNREILEAAQGSPFAENAWSEFQDFIELARETVAGEPPGLRRSARPRDPPLHAGALRLLRVAGIGASPPPRSPSTKMRSQEI